MKQYNILGGIDNLTEKQKKMITREEYLKAVQLIQDYRIQINSEIDGLNLIHQEDLISEHLNMYVVNSLTRFSQSAYNNYGLNIDRQTKVKDFKINMPLKQIRRIGGLGGRGMEQLIEFCTKINIKLK